MGKITKLFGRKDQGSDPPPRDIAALVAPFAVPAVRLVISSEEQSSYFGGEPTVGSNAQWPTKDGSPLSFLASLHLPTLKRTKDFDWLPAEGNLLFFYDVESQPWGFDPKDRGSWAVMHLAEGFGVAGQPPPVPAIPQRHLQFRRIRSMPSWQRPQIQALGLTDGEADLFCDNLQAALGDAAAHQVGGYPDPVQGDHMELECQLVSNGIYCGDSSGYESARAAKLAGGAKDWRLLLQFASDDALDVMWGDFGNLYFWVREQDARAGQFDRVWTVLQCS